MQTPHISPGRLRVTVPALLAVVAISVVAQEPATPNDPGAHIESLRTRAGSDWGAAVDFLCSVEPDVGTPAESEVVEPTRVFDNLYVVGRSGTVVYIIETTEGLVLIDAGYDGQEETVLLPGLISLGLDPEDITHVLVAHGHRDHYGGARYLQQQYGAKVILSAADWEVVEQSTAQGNGALIVPTRDMVAVEGEPLVFGDTLIHPVLIPGHTPGSLGFVFEVRDGDDLHTAALFGGTILIASRISDDGLRQYINSVKHFAQIAEDMGVDVEIQNHPIFDGFPEKLRALADRGTADDHPFVLGGDAYQAFLEVISGCTQVELERRDKG